MFGFFKKKVRGKIEKLIDKKIAQALSMSALDVAVDIAVGNQVEGDYLEFGVYTGQSFIRAYTRFQTSRNFYGMSDKMRYFAFDSFEGLPAISDNNNVPVQFSKGAYKSTEAVFRRNLKDHEVDLSKIVVIKKWFDELDDELRERHQLTKAAVIYLDCDLYESTRDALKFVTNIIQDGTIIVLDDYYRHKCSPDAGVRRAWNEFSEHNPQFRMTMVHNFRRVAFAVNKY